MSNSVGGSLEGDEISAGQGNHEAGEGREDVRPSAMLPVVIDYGRERGWLKIAALSHLSRGLILAYCPRIGSEQEVLRCDFCDYGIADDLHRVDAIHDGCSG